MHPREEEEDTAEDNHTVRHNAAVGGPYSYIPVEVATEAQHQKAKVTERPEEAHGQASRKQPSSNLKPSAEKDGSSPSVMIQGVKVKARKAGKKKVRAESDSHSPLLEKHLSAGAENDLPAMR